jgi:hypothetical protein
MEEELLNQFYADTNVQESIKCYKSQISDKKITPYTAGKMVLNMTDTKLTILK